MLNMMRSIAGWLAGIEIWLILLLVGFSLIWSAMLGVTVVVGVVFWFLRWIGVGRFTVRTPADWGILCLVGFSFFSLLVTQFTNDSITQYLRLYSGVILYYAIVNWTDQRNRVSTLILGIILIGLGLAAFSMVGVEWAAEKFPFLPRELYSHFLRLVSDMANPNVIAGSLVILLPILFAVLLFTRRKEFKSKREHYIWWLAVITVICMSLVLGLTLSRGSWIAGMLSILLVIGLRWKWGWLVFPLAGVAIWAASSLIGWDVIVEALLSSRTLVSLNDRVDLWSRSILISRTFPYTGIGMGSFKPVADIFFPSSLAQPGTGNHAHNLFLQIAIDLGLPGLIAWLSILITLSVTSWRLFRRGKRIGDSWITALGAGLLSSQLALIAHGMLDVVIWGMVRPAPIVWAIWGIVASLGYLYLRPLFRHGS